jgi:hypothetical protein
MEIHSALTRRQWLGTAGSVAAEFAASKGAVTQASASNQTWGGAPFRNGLPQDRIAVVTGAAWGHWAISYTLGVCALGFSPDSAHLPGAYARVVGTALEQV